MHGTRQQRSSDLPTVLRTGTCIHAVPGRLRLRIPSLEASSRMAATLERELGGVEGIHRVEANPLTGNVLLVYDESGDVAGPLVEAALGPGPSWGRPPGRRRMAGQLVRERVVDAVVRSTIEAVVTTLIRSFLV